MRSESPLTIIIGDVSTGSGGDLTTLDPATRALQISCFGDVPPPAKTAADATPGTDHGKGWLDSVSGHPLVQVDETNTATGGAGGTGTGGAGGAGGNAQCFGGAGGAGGTGVGGNGGAANAGGEGENLSAPGGAGSGTMGKVGERTPGATCAIPLAGAVTVQAVLDAVKACCEEEQTPPTRR
jgi:hypothetical protein